MMEQKEIKQIVLTLECPKGSELQKALDLLLADLANASPEIQSQAIGFLDDLSKLVRFESAITAVAVVTVLLKPSDFLLDLSAAVRAGDLNRLVVEQAHGFSFVENELVELPILPTSEKPTN